MPHNGLKLLRNLSFECEQHIKSTIPRDDKLLKSLLSLVTTELLNIQTLLPNQQQQNSEFCTVVASKYLNISVFGDSIPIHDHINIVGWAKLLKGKVLVKKYQMLNMGKELICDSKKKIFQCKKTYDKIIDYDETLSSDDHIFNIERDGPNLHSFEALTDEVILFDIVGPPFDEVYRPCHCFRVLDDSELLLTIPTINQNTNLAKKKKKKKKKSKSISNNNLDNLLDGDSNSDNRSTFTEDSSISINGSENNIASTSISISRSSSNVVVESFVASSTTKFVEENLVYLQLDPDLHFEALARQYQGPSVPINLGSV